MLDRILGNNGNLVGSDCPSHPTNAKLEPSSMLVRQWSFYGARSIVPVALWPRSQITTLLGMAYYLLVHLNIICYYFEVLNFAGKTSNYLEMCDFVELNQLHNGKIKKLPNTKRSDWMQLASTDSNHRQEASNPLCLCIPGCPWPRVARSHQHTQQSDMLHWLGGKFMLQRMWRGKLLSHLG